MKRVMVFLLILALAANLCACAEAGFFSNVLSAVIAAGVDSGAENSGTVTGVIGGADGPTEIFVFN